jgi:hypothetical protein
MSAANENYFNPFNIIVSNGSEEYSHILNNKAEENHVRLWKEAKKHISTILNTGNTGVEMTETRLDIGEWSNLLSKKAIIFDFKTSLPSDLISWFLDIKKPDTAAFTGISKLLVSPWESLNYNNITIYIRDDRSNAIKKYILKVESGWMNRSDYDDIFKSIDSSVNGLKDYRMIKFISNLPFIGDDVMGVVKKGKSSFYSVTSSVPNEIKENTVYTDTELNSLAERIIGPEKGSYSNIQDNETVEFLTQKDNYKIYWDGMMEYKYLPEPSVGDMGACEDAFKNAYDFVSKLTSQSAETGLTPLISGARLYMSGIKEIKGAKDEKDGKQKSGYYEFAFDYVINDAKSLDASISGNDIPVQIRYSPSKGKMGNINHAIVIKADSKRVLECTALIRKFSINTNDIKYYNTYFYDLMDKALLDNKKLKKAHIKDIEIYYSVAEGADAHNVLPVWVITDDLNQRTRIPMFF